MHRAFGDHAAGTFLERPAGRVDITFSCQVFFGGHFRHIWRDALTPASGGATTIVMEPRIASLEAITESTAKAVEELHRRVDDGFWEIRCEIRDLRAEVNEKIDDLRAEVNKKIDDLCAELNKKIGDLRAELNKKIDDLRAEVKESINDLRSEVRDVRNESNERSEERRTEMREMFRWLIGIQITTLFALLGLFAKVADIF